MMASNCSGSTDVLRSLGRCATKPQWPNGIKKTTIEEAYRRVGSETIPANGRRRSEALLTARPCHMSGLTCTDPMYREPPTDRRAEADSHTASQSRRCCVVARTRTHSAPPAEGSECGNTCPDTEESLVREALQRGDRGSWNPPAGPLVASTVIAVA